MPTVSWIQETVEDRYYEKFGGEPTPPSPPVYRCAVCDRKFNSIDARSWHASAEHPMARPTLYLGDRAAPSEIVVRTAFSAGSVRVDSSTSMSIVLDGEVVGPVLPAGLGELLQGRAVGHLVIELENHRAVDAADVRATYVIQIGIPDEDELVEVDRAFVQYLAVDRPSTRDVESFALGTESYTTARAYAGALTDYVHGVLIKEGSDFGGATLPFEVFQAKFSRAVVELADHTDRPVAATVVAASKLNLNDVVTVPVVSGDRRLNGCLHVLREIATRETPTPPTEVRGGSEVELCPIDRDTHLVLTAYEALVEARTSMPRIEEFEGRADDGTLSPQDRAKLRVLLAFAAIGGQNRAASTRHLEALVHDAVFASWAERELEHAL